MQCDVQDIPSVALFSTSHSWDSVNHDDCQMQAAREQVEVNYSLDKRELLLHLHSHRRINRMYTFEKKKVCLSYLSEDVCG